MSDGRIVGSRLGEQGLASAGRTDHQNVMRARGSDQNGSLGVVLAFHINEIFFHVRELAEDFVQVDRLWLHVNLARQKADGFGQAADGIDVEAFNDGRFRGVGGWNEQAGPAFGGGLERHG